jgi:hypothetical protein
MPDPIGPSKMIAPGLDAEEVITWTKPENKPNYDYNTHQGHRYPLSA